MNDQVRHGEILGPASAMTQANDAPNVTGFGRLVTAQRVAVRRNMPEVMNDLKVLVASYPHPEKLVYSIPYKDKFGKVTRVEGPSIKLAMLIAGQYGNCQVLCIEDPHASTDREWVFQAAFVDLEKGNTFVRPFRQRRSQNTGMKDNERAQDGIYQIGVSKATRNVVVNALDFLADMCVGIAKNGLVEKIKKDPEGIRDRQVKWFAGKGIDLKRVERQLTKVAKDWTPFDMARLWAEIEQVNDGFQTADELWPTPEAEAAERQAAENAPAGPSNPKPVTAQQEPPPPEGTEAATGKPQEKAAAKKAPAAPKKAAAAPDATPATQRAPAEQAPPPPREEPPPPADDDDPLGGADDGFGR